MRRQRAAASMGLGAELGKPWHDPPGARPRRPPVVTRRAARFEDEAGTGAGLFAAHTLVEQDHEPSIQELADVDRAPRIRTPAAQLDPARAEPHGVVAR